MNYIQREIPVIISMQRQNVVAIADVYSTPDKLLIQITVTGSDTKVISEFLEQVEPIGLSFNPIPVQNSREKREAT